MNNPYLTSYTHARERFIAAATASGARLNARKYPALGPDGEELFVDCAQFGARTAKKVLVTFSGTHGVEGYCGSGIQTLAMAQGLYRDLPDDTSVVLIHGVSPYGFAWCRRTDENGVDPSRNALDFSKPLPQNEVFDQIVEYLVPDSPEEQAKIQADQDMASVIMRVGIPKLKQYLPSGQYKHPHAPFYGGTGPSKAQVFTRELLHPTLERVSFIAAIDYHTGLGACGSSQMLGFDPVGSKATRDAVACWGDGQYASVYSPDSVAYPVHGNFLNILEFEAPQAHRLAAVNEFGTKDEQTVLGALREDFWVRRHGDPTDPNGVATRAIMKDAFYIPTQEWRDEVWAHAQRAERAALDVMANA